MEKKILVISWFYPPVNSSEGLVTYKLLKYSKYSYDIFTQKNSKLWSYGNDDILPRSQNINPVFAKANSFTDWISEALAYYEANKEKYDILMTRSMPPESHKIGLSIKKLNPNIKWIASFGDPIAENPYVKLSLNCASPHSIHTCSKLIGILSPKRIVKNTIFRIKHKKLEKQLLNKDFNLQKQIIKNADYLIFNNSYQKDYMLSNYIDSIQNKAIILNHSFDKTLYPLNKDKDKNNKIVMSYVGHLDTFRNPILLFNAIKDLSEENFDLSSKVCFNFYGNMSDSAKLFIINNELTDIIKVKKPVPYLESLSIMNKSDWLIHIDANISSVIDRNIFFAAKLADYIGTGNKIFGITMLDGISADILRELNAVTVSYSKEEIKNYLWLIIYNNYNVKIDKICRKRFDSVEVAKNFDTFIESIKK